MLVLMETLFHRLGQVADRKEGLNLSSFIICLNKQNTNLQIYAISYYSQYIEIFFSI